MLATGKSWRGGLDSERNKHTSLSMRAQRCRLQVLEERSTASLPGPRRSVGIGIRHLCQRIACRPVAKRPAQLLVRAAAGAAVGPHPSYSTGVPEVLGATTAASFKLFLLCAAVGWMVKTGRIPMETGPVLSKVAFQIMIPCFLFSKVAATLSQHSDPSLLAIPVCAIAQVLFGAALGSIASKIADASLPQDVRLLGWHPAAPTRSSAAIAITTAAAVGVPQAAPALVPRPKPAPEGTRQLVAAACAFGNSLTLPLVFLLTLLPASAADRAAGYTALFLMGWSPMLWSFGYRLLSNAGPSTAAARPALAEGSSAMVLPAESAGGQRVVLAGAADGGTRTVSAVEAAAIRVTNVVTRAVPAVREFAAQVVNPPLIGVLAGILAGITPLGGLLFGPAGAAMAAAGRGATAPLLLSSELRWLLGLGRSAAEVVAMLGAATLAVQAVVLGASMFQTTAQAPDRTAAPRSSGWAAMLLPQDSVEARALAVVSLVRLVCMPLFSVALVTALQYMGLFPIDPVAKLAVLVQGTMPSAQNLVLLMQLRPSTQPLAPRMARLLLRLYIAAILPLTLWVSLFIWLLPVPLASI